MKLVDKSRRSESAQAYQEKVRRIVDEDRTLSTWAVSDPLTQAMIYGCEIDSDGTAESANRVAAYHQSLVQQGLVTQG